MSKTQWSGYFGYKAKHTDIDSELKGSWIPVTEFYVKGGTKRNVDLSISDDISVYLELKEVQSLKNISLSIPRTKGFEWHHLWEIAEHGLSFSMFFSTSGKMGYTLLHEFTLSCNNAKINQKPNKYKDWYNREVLRVELSLPEAKLLHGFQQEGGKYVQESR